MVLEARGYDSLHGQIMVCPSVRPSVHSAVYLFIQAYGDSLEYSKTAWMRIPASFRLLFHREYNIAGLGIGFALQKEFGAVRICTAVQEWSSARVGQC